MMLDVTSILTDPELGATTFTVERTVYKRVYGDAVPEAVATFEVIGCVHPGAPEQIDQLPEEDRHEEFIVIFAPTVLKLGENHGLTFSGPDRIGWDGRKWRLVKLKAWTAFGFVQGFAVLLRDEES